METTNAKIAQTCGVRLPLFLSRPSTINSLAINHSNDQPHREHRHPSSPPWTTPLAAATAGSSSPPSSCCSLFAPWLSWWLVKQLQAVIADHNAQRENLPGALSEMIKGQNEMALKLAICIDRNTAALEEIAPSNSSASKNQIPNLCRSPFVAIPLSPSQTFVENFVAPRPILPIPPSEKLNTKR